MIGINHGNKNRGIIMTNKIKKLRIFSCASMVILSSVLVGCGNQQEEQVATDVTEEVEPEVKSEQNTEEEQTLMDKYMNLPIYNDHDRAAFEDMRDSFEGAFDTSSLEEFKEDWALKIDYFKRFLQNDPNATYGGYTLSELSDEAQKKAKELYHSIDGYFSEHISSYDELKEKFYAYENYIPGQKEIEYLAELNLLKTSEAYRECDIYSIEEMKLNFAVGDKKFDATSPYDADENRYYVCVGQVLFTQTGLALYNAISRNIEKYQYLYDVLKTYIEYRSQE